MVDELAWKLSRAIAVDNADIEVIAASAQIGQIDQARSESILKKRTADDVAEYARSFGIAAAREPVRIPPHPELATLPRYCIPLRRGDYLLGFLWIIDEPALTPQEWRVINASLNELTEHVARTVTDSERRVVTSDALLTELLGTDSAPDLEELSSRGLLTSEGSLIAFSLSLTHGHQLPTSDSLFTVLESYLRSPTSSRSLVGVVDGALAIFARSVRSEVAKRAVTSAIRQSASKARLRLTASGAVEHAAGTSLAETLRDASFARDVARATMNSELVQFESLGAWQLLRDVPRTREAVGALSEAAIPLLSYRGAPLWRTVLTYLESDRDLKRTCEALSISRATLYYRLERAREISGSVAQQRGWDNIDLHLALRLWSLSQLEIAR